MPNQIAEEQRQLMLKKELLLLKELRKRQCESSLYEFVLDAHYYLFNERLDKNWHLEYVCGEVQKEIERIIRKEPKEQDIIINIPPRSLKSFAITICAPAWAWIHKPSLKFIGSSYSGDLSLQHNVWTKDIIKTDWYQRNWPTVKISKDKDTKEYFETSHKGIRTCTSTGGSVTGLGGDVIIIDDPTNPKKALSDVERETANRFFNESLTTRLNDPKTGLFIIIMQRLHEDDLTGHLLKKDPKKYKHICIPAELTDSIRPKELSAFYEDGLFFKNRFTKEWLDNMKISLGSYGYAGQMLQSPKIEGGGMIQGSWFGRFKLKQLPDSVVWNFCADTAYTKKTINDPSGILCYAVHDNNLYIKGYSTVYKEFPDLIKHIRAYTKEMGYSFRSKFRVEPKASGISVVQQLKKQTRLNIIQDIPPDTDKVTRAADASPTVESGRVFLLEGAHWVDTFIYEVEMFPNGQHDEAIDLLCMAVRDFQKKSRKINYSFPKKRI